MVLSFRLIYYIPWGIFLILNVTFLTLIFILRVIGKSTVWINNNISNIGDYFGDLSRNDDKLDKFIKKVNILRKRKGY